THRLRIPVRRIQEALHALRSAFSQRLSQLPAILALDAQQQPRQVAPSALTRLASPKVGGNAGLQVCQSGWAYASERHRLGHEGPPSAPEEVYLILLQLSL